MTISELGSLGEFVGAILLFASLIYLGIQIRQGNRTDKLSATIAFENQYRDIVTFFAGTSESSAVMAKGLKDLSSLTMAEIHMFGPRLYGLYRHAELAHEQVQKGLLDPDILERTMKIIAIYHDDPGALDWFNGHGKLMLNEDFHQYVTDYFSTD